jgi:hypothetical protein
MDGSGNRLLPVRDRRDGRRRVFAVWKLCDRPPPTQTPLYPTNPEVTCSRAAPAPTSAATNSLLTPMFGRAGLY